MAERSSAGIAHALREGFARVVSAPAVLFGMFVLIRLLDLPADDAWTEIGGVRGTFTPLLFWAFAYGGAIDRYARNRPTRGHGFFGACGRHAMPLARLAIFPLALAYGLVAIPHNAVVALIVMVLADLTLLFSRVRLVVEDRRSAIGSLAAGVRFIGRNVAAAAGLYAVFAALAYAQGEGYRALPIDFSGGAWTSRLAGEASLAVGLFLRLAAYASATVLFQSRLAHASYTAAPAVEWPESASAEAIANAPPRMLR